MSVIDEEKQNYHQIKKGLNKSKEYILKSKSEIFKLYDDPLLIDAFLEEYERKLFNFEKHKDTPYFARINYLDKEEQETINLYIGKIGFANIDKDTLIVDWRTPVCDLYYNGELGDCKYKVEDKQREAVLNLKRQINFENGEIVSTYDFDKTISNDELLKPYLSQHADNRLKNIVSTIQKEQNEIIRYPLNKNIIVQGVAGSGKTTVALHRLSYLLYNYKKLLKPYEYMILSPNKVFTDYVSTLLPELDAKDVLNTELENLVKDLTKTKITVLNKNNQKDYLEKNNKSYEYLSFKTGLEFAELLNKFIKDFEDNSFIKPLVIENVEILSKEKVKNIYNEIEGRNCQVKFDKLCQKIGLILRNNLHLRSQILDELFKQQKIGFALKLKLDNIFEKGCENYYRRNCKIRYDILVLYKDFIKNLKNYCDLPIISDLQKNTLNNLKNNVLSYDDIGAILYLYSQIFEIEEKYNDIKSVFIDEAQDLGALIFLGLKNIFYQANFSIFGDIAQGMYSYQSIKDWKDLENVFEDKDYLSLNKSYRTTVQIMQNANQTLKLLNLPLAENVLRNGEEVETINCKDKFSTILGLVENLKQKYKTITIIFKNDNELKDFETKNVLSEFKSVNENTQDYQGNNLLMTVKTAKGLEFDAVIIYDLNSYKTDNDTDLKELFVAKTRALHKLIILN